MLLRFLFFSLALKNKIYIFLFFKDFLIFETNLSDLRIRFYKMYLKLDYVNFIKRNSSEKLRNLQEATICLRSLDAFLSVFTEALVLIGIIALLMYFFRLDYIISFFYFFKTSTSKICTNASH